MKKHFVLIFCLAAAGCTDADWDHALNYVYPAPDDAHATAGQFQPQPATAAVRATASIPNTPASVAETPASNTASSAPAAPANADFCRAVAAQDAGGNGFDPATQQRVFARSYGQCVAIYSR